MKPVPVSSGTTPLGISDQQEASRWVERMFAGIAFRYDFLNHLLSFNIDRGWRRVLLREIASTLARTDAKVLDLCCGTGDVLLDLKKVAKAEVFGADFCHPMLTRAQSKARQRGFRALLLEADALKLPVADESFDCIAISFGFRNLVDYRAGLAELYRVVKGGGRVAILEFSHPPGLLMRMAYSFYLRVLLPIVGRLVSGSREAYGYLPASIAKFPRASQLKIMMVSAGFARSEFQLLTGGIAALHVGTKPVDSSRP